MLPGAITPTMLPALTEPFQPTAPPESPPSPGEPQMHSAENPPENVSVCLDMVQNVSPPSGSTSFRYRPGDRSGSPRHLNVHFVYSSPATFSSMACPSAFTFGPPVMNSGFALTSTAYSAAPSFRENSSSACCESPSPSAFTVVTLSAFTGPKCPSCTVRARHSAGYMTNGTRSPASGRMSRKPQRFTSTQQPIICATWPITLLMEAPFQSGAASTASASSGSAPPYS